MSDETKPDLPTTTDDEARPDLDLVTDLVSESILPAPIRRNALKAFDRLCSALIDVPVGALERRAAEKRAESEARIKIRDEITTQITQQIKVDPEYALRAGHKFAEKIIREQLNLDKISVIAADELKNGGSGNPTNSETKGPNKEQSADSTNRNVNSGEEKTINDVWLNIFETEARPQSTEEGRLLFGRILAGEIRNPGSYSMRTIKTLGELDQDVAALFKNLCSLSTGHIKASSGNISSLNVLTLENEFLSSHALEKYGLSYDAISTMQEYGLVLDTNFSYWHFKKLPILLRHQGQNWMVSPAASNKEENQELQLFGIYLSRTARELYNLVDQDLTPEYTENFKKFLIGLNLTVTEVDIISVEKDKGISWVKAKPKRD